MIVYDGLLITTSLKNECATAIFADILELGSYVNIF